MFVRQQPKIAVAVTLVLLLFSAADLFADVGGFSLCSSDAAIELHEYLPHESSHEYDPSRERSSHPEQHHIDDCFCCSDCVRHTTAFALSLGEFVTVIHRDPAVVTRPVLVRELFRPPRTS